MAKPKILLADSDEKSLSMMTISLKKAGFNVTAGRNGEEAWELVRTTVPDLIISDTKMPRMDGFTFCRKLKEDPAFKSIPFIFLTREKNVDDKIRGLELGVDDYLTKPIYLKEVLARVKLLLEKREKERVDFVPQDPQFSGSLLDMGVVDLIQTMELGQKTGVVYLSRAGIQSTIAFLKGRILDATVANIRGENAVYKLLLWSDGTFRIDFKSVDDVETSIHVSTQGLIMEGMRRIDELVRIKEQLPPLESYLAIDSQMILEEHPDQFPEKIENILAEFTGQQTIQQVVDKLAFDDLESMEIIAKLYFQGFLMPVNAPEQAAVTESSSEEPLFNFAPPEEDDEDEASIAHIFQTGEAEEPSKAAQPAPAEIDVDVDVEIAERPSIKAPQPAAAASPTVAEAPPSAGSEKAKPKQGKVIFLKNSNGAAATAAKQEPESAPETMLETVAIPSPVEVAPEVTVETPKPQKAKPVKAREIKLPSPQQRKTEPPKPASPPVAPPPKAPSRPAVKPPVISIPAEPAAPIAPPVQAPLPAAAIKKSNAPLFAGLGLAVVLAAGGAGYFFLSSPGSATPEAAATTAAGNAGASTTVDFRDAALKLTGESLDIYRGASLDMNLDTETGYRRAIQGFESLAAQNGWVDGTDQEIVLSKLVLSYARLSTVQDDPAPLAKAHELSTGYLADRSGSGYLILADAEQKARAKKTEDARAGLRLLGLSADKFYLYHYVDGLVRLNSGDVPDLAIVSLRKSIELRSDFTLAHYELARAYEASRRQVDAAAEYKRVTELSPNHADAHFRLAKIAKERDERDQAIRHAETAVAVDQSFLPAQLILAELLVDSGKSQNAAAHIQSVLDLGRPGNDDVLIVDAHKLAGRVALEAGNREQARREFDLALQIAPSDGEAKDLLAKLDTKTVAPAAAPAAPPKPTPVVAAKVEAPAPKAVPAPAAPRGPSIEDLKRNVAAYSAGQDLYRKGMLKNAVARLQEAVQAVPTDDKSWTLLGQIYIEIGKDADALKALQRAISINPNNADAHVNLGGLYDAMGDTAKATASYKTYLRLEPKGRFANDIRTLISTRR